MRIGINLGDVLLEEGDLYRNGVNIASRLEGLAEPGGILIPGTAYDQVEGKLSLALAFTGEQRVKNIERSVRTYRIELAGSPKARTIAAPHFRNRPSMVIATATAVLVLALGAGGAWWYWDRGVVPPPRPQAAQPLEPLPAGKVSLAVLPLASPGGDARQERLADGISEDRIAELGRYRNIAVIAKSSSFAFKGKTVDARQVGRELGVL